MYREWGTLALSPQDETRPICNRCQRAGLQCTGARDTAFIAGTIVKSRRSEKRISVSKKTAGEDADSALWLLPLSAPLKGNDSEIYICYTRRQLRKGAPIDVALDDMHLHDLAMDQLTTTDRVFHPTILSFATILFGTQHRQTTITDRGYALHGVALKQLNQALTKSKCYTRDDVLLSVVSLAILECLVPTGQKHYLNHMIGLERLLELRDPWAYCSSRTCELYKSVRHMLIFASLRTGRTSVFARPEWKMVLRASCSNEEIPEQDLFDVLADCTVLVAERDVMLLTWDSRSERNLDRRDSIKQSALVLLTDLHNWKMRWARDGKNAYSETRASFDGLEATQNPVGDSMLSTSFVFSYDPAAIMLMFYNTTLIYVLRILASLPPGDDSSRPQSPSISPTATSLAGLCELTTTDDFIAAGRLAAIEVCRCIPHYLARSTQCESDASPIVHWAVTTAWMTVGGNESTEGRWMMDLLNTKNGDVIAKALWTS